MTALLAPHDAEAERAVIGSVMIRYSVLPEALAIIEPEDFYVPRHRLVFEEMAALEKRGEPIDHITVQAGLRARGKIEAAGGPAAIIAYAEAIPTEANVRHYAEIVRDKAALRRLADAARAILATTVDGTPAGDAIDAAEQAVFAVGRPDAKGGLRHIGAAAEASYDAAIRAFERGDVITGLATGFTDLDRMTAGLQAGDLIIVGARPSMGKTSFVLNIATHVSIRGEGVTGMFSLETEDRRLAARLVSTEARIDLLAYRSGKMSTREWQAGRAAVRRIAESRIFVDDHFDPSLADIRSRARRLSAEKGLALLIVDYLQLMRGLGGSQNREREVAELSRGLKRLAKELRVPVVALSQLNRGLESRTEKRPMLSDLRDSGAVEQDADVVLFVYRDEVYDKDTPDKGIAEIIIAKQRDGGLGTVRLAFDAQHTRFSNLSDRDPPPTVSRTYAAATERPDPDAHDVLAEARRNGATP